MKQRVRRPGGGRKKREQTEPTLISDIEKIIDRHVAGCPVTGVKWTYLSIIELGTLLEKQRPKASPSWPVCKRILKTLGYGRRSLAKMETMKQQDAERDAQFRAIAEFREDYLSKGYAVLSVDIKKKELLGRFHRPGQCLSQGRRECFDHDFASFAQGKVVPHGIYDVGRNEGHITLCASKDTAEFNVDCLRRYWHDQGRHNYAAGTPVLLLLDGGGSNGYRNRLFKQELQDWADEAGLNLRVAHFPAYCSKYNPIEHRLFPHISRAWSGVMLDSMTTMKELINSRLELLKCSLSVSVSIVKETYATGWRVYDDFLDRCDIRFDELRPERNYQILAMPKSDSY